MLKVARKKIQIKIVTSKKKKKKKRTCRWYSDHFICSIPVLSLLFFFVIERSALIALVF